MTDEDNAFDYDKLQTTKYSKQDVERMIYKEIYSIQAKNKIKLKNKINNIIWMNDWLINIYL